MRELDVRAAEAKWFVDRSESRIYHFMLKLNFIFMWP